MAGNLLRPWAGPNLRPKPVFGLDSLSFFRIVATIAWLAIAPVAMGAAPLTGQVDEIRAPGHPTSGSPVDTQQDFASEDSEDPDFEKDLLLGAHFLTEWVPLESAGLLRTHERFEHAPPLVVLTFGARAPPLG